MKFSLTWAMTYQEETIGMGFGRDTRRQDYNFLEDSEEVADNPTRPQMSKS